MTDFLNELRLAARPLLKNPGYAAVVIVTLALAIGANTIIFSFTDLFLLRPLPVGDPARVVFLYSVDMPRGVNRGHTSLLDFLDWKAQATTFDQMAAFTQIGYTLTGSGEPLRVTAMRTTASLATTWDLKTVEGRTFLAGEDAPGAAKVALLSHRFWAEHFASDRTVVGRSLTLSGEPYTVVGVLAPDIEIGNLADIDIWLALTMDAAGARRDDRSLTITARLKPGFSIGQANVQLATIAERLQRAFPQTNGSWSAHALTLREAITGPNSRLILALLAIVVLFVLVIACANIANIMLARATTRQREVAVRQALGASRARLMWSLVAESLLLGVAGGTLGLGLAIGGLRTIQAASNEPFFRLLTINARVLVFVIALSVLAPLLFSVVPSWHGSRSDLHRALKEGGIRASGGPKGRRSRSALVVSQLALAVVLLVVAGLVTRTIAAVEHTPTGIDATNVLTVHLQLDPPAYRDLTQVVALSDQLSDRIGGLPGIRFTAVTNRLPLVDSEPTRRFQIEGRPAPGLNDMPWANAVGIAGAYLRTFNLRLIAGRAFTAHDDAATPNVALLSQAAVRRYWQGASPLGGHITLVGATAVDSPRVEVVGVVDDVKSTDLTEPPPPRLYRPLAQSPDRALVLALRTDGAPAAAAPAVREAIRAVDRSLAISQIRPLDNVLRDQFRENRVLLGMFVSFALVALLLSAAGLYGVTSHSVSQRTQEIGIRMALGATRGDVLALVIGQNARLFAVGAGLGVLGGVVLGRAMRTILYRVGATDPVTFAGVLAIMAAVAIAATYLPARRATTVDPLRCLRSE